LAASRSGKTVLLTMDLDTVDEQPGLTDYISGQATGIARYVQAVTPTFSEIGRGTVPQDPYTALSDPRLNQLFDALRRDYDTIVLAAPSTLDAAEGLLACSIADEVVLVVEEARSRTQDVVQSLHMLGLVVKTPVRLVMIQRSSWLRRRRGRPESVTEADNLATTETPVEAKLTRLP
jgi:Mrp family chromosome partitioning ATPase